MLAVTRLRRALAPVLAAVALVSALARPVLACGMAPERSRDAVTAPAEDAPAHHHAGPVEPVGPAAPDDSDCDHLVGCVSMVGTTATLVFLEPMLLPEGAMHTVAARHDAPVRTLEPPPPRA